MKNDLMMESTCISPLFIRLFLALALAITALQTCITNAYSVPIPPKAELSPQDMTLVYASNDKIFDCVLPLDDGRLLLQAPAWLGNHKGQLFSLNQGKLSPWPNEALNSTSTTSGENEHFIALAGLTKSEDGSIWVLDSGVRERDRPPLSAPKVYKIDPKTNHIIHRFDIDPRTLQHGSILNGIAVWHHQIYLPDSGVAGLVYLDSSTGISKRYLDHHFLLTAVHPLEGTNGVLTNKEGQPVTTDVSMVTVSPDGKALYMQAPTGRLIRIVTSVLLDPQISPTELQEGLTGWYITPHLGGMTTDKFGTLYWSDVTTNSIISYTTGRIPHHLIMDPRLQWPTTPGVSSSGELYVSASQLDRSSAFGRNATIHWPIYIYKIHIPKDSFPTSK